MNKELFVEELKKINIDIKDYQLEQLDKYYKILVEWNEKVNLTRIIEEEEVYLKHFYDSATLNMIVDLEKTGSMCDLGSGAGFPGIVIKILFPKLQITLVDSLNKRIIFLNYVIEELKLRDIKAVHSRIEDYSIKYPEKYDLVTARAVAKMNTLLELGARLIKINGFFVGMKANISREIEESANAMQILGLKMAKIEEFSLPIEKSTRTLIKIEKIKKTPKTYPRRIEKIKKEPL